MSLENLTPNSYTTPPIYNQSTSVLFPDTPLFHLTAESFCPFLRLNRILLALFSFLIIYTLDFISSSQRLILHSQSVALRLYSIHVLLYRFIVLMGSSRI